MSDASKKSLEIFHYATIEEMEEAKRRAALARTPQQRYDDMLSLIRLSFSLRPAHLDEPEAGTYVLPQRQRHGHL